MNDQVASIIVDRLAKKSFATDQEHLNAAKEVVQEIALLGLSRHGFFDKVAFQGGTAFRIFYGLDRFSEDLDFALLEPDLKFSFADILRPLKEEFESWGLSLEITDRTKLDANVRQAFIKETSLGAMLNLNLALPREQKLKVKVELDINPPAHAKFKSKLYHFPTDYYVTCYEIETMFAGKLHALLARKYEKGRDWYDLVEYIRKSIKPNLEFLKAALEQLPTWDRRSLPAQLELNWVKQALRERLAALSLNKLLSDVRPFVRDQNKISLWSKEYFNEKIDLL